MHRKTSYRSTLKLDNLYPLCLSSGTKYNLQLRSGQVVGANKSVSSGRTFEVPSPSSRQCTSFIYKTCIHFFIYYDKDLISITLRDVFN